MNKEAVLKEAIQQHLSEGKEITLTVTGKSMRPYLLGDGSEQVIVSPHTRDELKSGAIVLFLNQGNYIFHRILQINGNRLIIQGDGNCVGIEKIEINQVLGVVHHIIRKQGKKISTNSLSAQIYWKMWYAIRPFRKYFLYIYNKIR